MDTIFWRMFPLGRVVSLIKQNYELWNHRMFRNAKTALLLNMNIKAFKIKISEVGSVQSK